MGESGRYAYRQPVGLNLLAKGEDFVEGLTTQRKHNKSVDAERHTGAIGQAMFDCLQKRSIHLGCRFAAAFAD